MKYLPIIMMPILRCTPFSTSNLIDWNLDIECFEMIHHLYGMWAINNEEVISFQGHLQIQITTVQYEKLSKEVLFETESL